MERAPPKRSGGEAELQGGVGPGREAETRSLRSALGAAHSGASAYWRREESGGNDLQEEPVVQVWRLTARERFYGRQMAKIMLYGCRWRFVSAREAVGGLPRF